jgi:hypothetical protein
MYPQQHGWASSSLLCVQIEQKSRRRVLLLSSSVKIPFCPRAQTMELLGVWLLVSRTHTNSSSDSQVFGLQLGVTSIGFPGSQIFKLRLKCTTGFPGSPTGRSSITWNFLPSIITCNNSHNKSPDGCVHHGHVYEHVCVCVHAHTHTHFRFCFSGEL